MQNINIDLGLLFLALRQRKRGREERKKTRKDVPGGYKCHSVPADWIVQQLGKRDEANETSDRCSKAPPGFRDVPNFRVPPTNISSVCLILFPFALLLPVHLSAFASRTLTNN